MEIDRGKLFEDLVRLVKKYSKQDGDFEITTETNIKEIGIDSIDLMEIAFELEESHGLQIDESVAMNAETLGDLANAI